MEDRKPAAKKQRVEPPHRDTVQEEPAPSNDQLHYPLELNPYTLEYLTVQKSQEIAPYRPDFRPQDINRLTASRAQPTTTTPRALSPGKLRAQAEELRIFQRAEDTAASNIYFKFRRSLPALRENSTHPLCTYARQEIHRIFVAEELRNFQRAEDIAVSNIYFKFRRTLPALRENNVHALCTYARQEIHRLFVRSFDNSEPPPSSDEDNSSDDRVDDPPDAHWKPPST